MTVQANQPDFLRKMKRLDQATVTPRDVLILWTLKMEPGMMGLTLAKKLGIDNRSNIEFAIRRLLRLDMIEDRRTEIGRTIPNDFHITPKGEKFVDEIVGIEPAFDL